MKAGALVAALVVAAGASWLARPHAAAPAAPLADRAGVPPVAAPPQAARAAQAAGAGWFGEVARAAPVPAPVPAAESMADARRHGDTRTPPLAPPTAAGAGPTAAQLADPRAYQAYQAGQDARIMAAFANAAQLEVPRLRADVERARAAGLPAAQIAGVEAKIRRLEQLRHEIVNPAQLPRN
ncbi:hypothetical protein [Massilia pseudoviolaceinigra]|uniref:hypothetical protein n=1 Tax=Massilia pseudoviolaceinigra TaxID=3057165 RepID=UPI00279688EC|nr:hypothetical protein [Massilia sp. CCM 9206]MDQ1920073.1 hypothetical protein [Massilia sp. CCM 9206]